jgi:hypothetical protein
MIIRKSQGIHEPYPFTEFIKGTSNLMTLMTGGDLSKFSFIGIVEKFNESIRKLGKLLDVKFQENIYHNVTKTKLKFAGRKLDMLKEYNQEDLKLYEQALDIFYSRI